MSDVNMGAWGAGIVAAILALVLLAIAFVAITFAVRGTPVRRVRAFGGSTATDDGGDRYIDGMSPLPARSEDFCEIAKVLSHTALTEGHHVRYFHQGDALFDALLADVARAELLVTWHVFWFQPGRLADRVAETLTARARAGVKVLVMFDFFGSRGLGESYHQRLRDGGVEVVIFRPPRLMSLYKAQHRMHIRTVVIDGHVGYTGGFGIDDRWLGDGRHPGQWRDTSARIEGPAVRQLQGAFVANWAEATGDLLLGEDVFALDAPHDGPHTAGILASSPSLGSTSAERCFFTAIAAARERCYITSAYFVPDRYFRRLLRDAAERGVDVRVLTPGKNTDRRSTWYAARAHYVELLEGGVQLYEYRPTMVHAKTLVIDGVWSIVGTINFDNRSMVLNDEVALLVWDEDLGGELERAFLDDLEWAEVMTATGERARTTFGDRMRKWAAERVARLL